MSMKSSVTERLEYYLADALDPAEWKTFLAILADYEEAIREDERALIVGDFIKKLREEKRQYKIGS